MGNPNDFTTALDNLALAATTDQTLLATLVTTNADLVEMVKNLTASLATARPNASQNALKGHQASIKSFDPKGYCWTHGYMVAYGHSSQTCKHMHNGHQDTATHADIKGGSEKTKIG